MENKILIDSVNNLKVALNEISVYDFDVYTSMELYYKIAENFNKVIKELNRFEGVVSDEIIKQNEKLLYLLGEGLKIEVVDKINEMVETGVFDTIINLNIFNNLKEDIKNVSSQLEQNMNKINTIAIQLSSNGIDDTGQLRNAIANYKQVMVVGELIICDSITLRKGVKLYGNNKNTSRLKLINDVDFIYTTGNSELCDLTLIVPKNYTKDCLCSKSWKMDSVDNGKVHDINIMQTEDSNLPLGTAIKLESSSTMGGRIYFTNFNYYNIDVKGFWEYGIKTNIIYNVENDPTWLNVIKMNNIFINTAKTIIAFDYENNTGKELIFPLGTCFAEHIYNSVSGQFIEGKTEKFMVLKNIRMSKFDFCIPWDFNNQIYTNHIKPYEIYCDTKVKVELNGLMYSSNPIDIVNFKNGESDDKVNLNNCIPSYSLIDGTNKFVRCDFDNTFTGLQKFENITSTGYADFNKTRVTRVTDPDSLRLAMTSYKPIYYLANETTSTGLDNHFLGVRYDSNNVFGGTDSVYSYDLGINGSNRLVYRAKYQDNWSKFFNVITEKYFPNGSTSNRPSSTDINTGFMYFDTSKGKPIWWNGSAWVDANGIGV